MVEDEKIIDVLTDKQNIAQMIEDHSTESSDELWYFFPQNEERCRDGSCNCAMH